MHLSATARAAATGVPDKLHTLNHKGEYFSVRGPLNVARPPQGHPVILQAGSSETGKELAARHAEAVFTPQHTLQGAQAFYQDLKGRMPKYGRSPAHLKVLPELNAIVGRTEAEAKEKYAELQALIHPSVGLEVLSNAIGNFDLSGYDLDGPLPDAAFHSKPNSGSTTSFSNVLSWARNENMTIRQLYQRFAGARGQRTLIGSPSQIADDMEAWFQGYGVDGFLFHAATLPGGLEDFVNLVVPELQERGLFRTEYEGTTLRENWACRVPSAATRRDLAAQVARWVNAAHFAEGRETWDGSPMSTFICAARIPRQRRSTMPICSTPRSSAPRRRMAHRAST